ncbi:MAG: hypothetical protein JWP87_6444 [Labilithrix sp.]|nr:hypothetical protein [Labilithrix sp.]
MIARVVTKKDDARFATFVTSAAAAFLGLVLADDVWHMRLFRAPQSTMYVGVAAAIAIAGIGPWLAWSRRAGRATIVRCENGVVHAGKLRLEADRISALSVAHGVRGTSVAVALGAGKVTFLEVERAEDAARIAETLGVSRPPLNRVDVPEARRALAIPQAVFALLAAVFAPLYYIGATHGYDSVPVVPDPKAVFGVGGVIVAATSMVLLLLRHFLPHQALALGRSAWSSHAALHRARSDAEEQQADAAEEPVRIGNLARGDERVGAWLARIDAMPTEQHAYRGDAMKKDVLWDTLGDGGAPVDARMAAARVLRRRYGEQEEAIVRAVDDPEVRMRVEAACEELEDAERRIETLGPLFRAR